MARCRGKHLGGSTSCRPSQATDASISVDSVCPCSLLIDFPSAHEISPNTCSGWWIQYVHPRVPKALSGQICHVALSLSIIFPHQFKLLLPIRTSQTCLQPDLCVLVVPLEKAKYNTTMKGMTSKASCTQPSTKHSLPKSCPVLLAPSCGRMMKIQSDLPQARASLKRFLSAQS